MATVSGNESDPAASGVIGVHSNTGAGVRGESAVGPGVHGISQGTDPAQKGVGVLGQAIGTGVLGESQTFVGVLGFTVSTTGGAGVMGQSTTGAPGVIGESATGAGLMGTSAGTDPNQFGVGVFGKAIGTAIVGESQSGFGVFATTQTGEAAIRGDHRGDGFGGFFTGHVGVTGELRVDQDIRTLTNLHVDGSAFVRGDVQLVGADLAEEFAVDDGTSVGPGCVVVLTGPDRVTIGTRPYDRRVAGVVSGAGSYRPALVLDRRVPGSSRRWPLALAGKVWCWADADLGPIELGDPLTTSPTPGHAMLARDPARAFGAVLGKALAALTSGTALIPVLVTLN
jgi:hypothetical protein